MILDMQEELFSKRGKGWFRVVSGSMRPLIEVGDRILVKKAGAEEIRSRDVILFKRDGAFVTHRVLKISEVDGKQMILQKGDAGGIPDTIPDDSVIGRVTVVEKSGKPLRLDSGRLGALNHFLGLKSGCSYRIGGTLFVLKNCMKAESKATLPFLFSGSASPSYTFYSHVLPQVPRSAGRASSEALLTS